MKWILVLIIHLGNGQTDEIPHSVELSLDECEKMGIHYTQDLRDGVVGYRCEPATDE